MPAPVGITSSELEIVRKILTDYSFLFFGSRTNGTHKKSSDLDICLRGDLPVTDQKMAELRSAFQDSNLPYKVDLVDWHRLSSDFQRIVLEAQVQPLAPVPKGV